MPTFTSFMLRPRSPRGRRVGSRSASRIALGSILSVVVVGTGIAAVAAAQAKESTCPGRAPITKDLALGRATLDLNVAWTCRSVDVWGSLDNPSSNPMTAVAAILPQRIPLFAQTTVRKDVGISSGWHQVNAPGGAGTVVIALWAGTNPPKQSAAVVYVIAQRP